MKIHVLSGNKCRVRYDGKLNGVVKMADSLFLLELSTIQDLHAA